MHFKLDYVILLLALFSISNATYAQHNNTSPGSSEVLPAGELKPVGRALLNQAQELELISSAVHFGFGFTGKECTIYASVKDPKAHNYLQYDLDGIYQERLKIEGGSTRQMLIKAATDAPHTVWIYKATEATTGPVVVQKIMGKNLKAMHPSLNPLIEFIGNSITSGAAADTSEVKCGQGVYHDQHNAYYAYGPRVARSLGLEYILSSVSGIGIYRTWNMESPGMPMVYEKESFQLSDSVLWNFKKYAPEIVSIALGTNDLSRGDGVHPRRPFDSSIFVKEYTSFVQLVKSKYPTAKIALLSSPMINGDNRIVLQNCLTAVKQNIDALYPSDKPVTLFFFEPMKAGGCTGHPSVSDHAILAQQLTPFFKNLLE